MVNAFLCRFASGILVPVRASPSDLDGPASGTRFFLVRPRIFCFGCGTIHSEHNYRSCIGGGATGGAHRIQPRLIAALFNIALSLVLGCQDI